ncbi:MAG: hypothetical protein KatS3mg081_0015 [Gemmatimonadales bacterium]|nr:MAG: hypothetical protein KatS3mg081_0015 [Gemmatimonadales bacterium]
MLLTSSLFAGVLGAVVLLWNRSFVTLWVGDEHYAGMWVNLFLVLMAVQLLLIRNDTYLIDLTLNVRRKVILGFVSFLISSSIAVVLAPFLGVMGLCLGILLGRLVLTLAYPTLTGTFLGSSLPAQLRPLLRPGLLMGALFVVSAYIGEIASAKKWLHLIAYIGINVPLMFVAMFWGGFSAQQRTVLIRRVMNLTLKAQNG